jgi:hypothetical protein
MTCNDRASIGGALVNHAQVVNPSSRVLWVPPGKPKRVFPALVFLGLDDLICFSTMK